MSKELVTIIVPMYNHEKYIIDCLESIKNQTYNKIELLIADDCSSDNSFNLASKWVKENKECFIRCELSKNERNIGVVKSMNGLVKRARGGYIKSIASDDMLLTNAIESLVNSLKADDDLVCGNGVIIDENAHYPLDNKDIKGNYYSRFKRKFKFDKVFNENGILAPGVLFRTSTFEEYGLFSEECEFEDWEYWIRILSRGGKISYLKEKVVAYRSVTTSLCRFGNSEEEKKRLERVAENNISMLDYYAQGANFSSNRYRNSVVSMAINQGNDKLIKKIVESPDFKFKPLYYIKYLLYVFSKRARSNTNKENR
ncbi:MAG: glycosyltransferase [Pseudobutyrivibrio sp.]|nr:glycosyltransferase [Pseudobutyrivibrio sp.]